MTKHPAVTFVIMAGGKGERLWPLVRSATPKVCLSPDGTRSLLAATIDRLRLVWPHPEWLIVTTNGQAEAVRAALPSALRDAVLVEPQVKNTAACITLAAVTLAMRDPHRVMVVTPADHWVSDVPAFRQALRTAIRAAVAHDTIVTIGIRPTHPHTGLGYLCAGARLGAREGRAGASVNGARAPRMYRLKQFIEKPSTARAAALVKQPRTYWNSGTFVGTADKFLESVTQWLPEHTRRLVPLAETLHGHRRFSNASFLQRARAAYRALEEISFDHGVMDHLSEGLVVEGQFRWADLGSWDVWAQLGRASSRTIGIESENITVVGQEGHLVATIGVRDLVIVQTPSATLICHPQRAQAVREIVKRLALDPRLASYQ